MNCSNLLDRKAFYLFALLFFSSNFIIGQSFFHEYEGAAYNSIIDIQQTNSGFELETTNTSITNQFSGSTAGEILTVDAAGNFISSASFPGLTDPTYTRLSNGDYLKSPDVIGENALNYTIRNNFGQVVRSFSINFPATGNIIGGGAAAEYPNGDLLITYSLGTAQNSNVARVNRNGQVIWNTAVSFNTGSIGRWIANEIAINNAQEAFIQMNNSGADQYRMIKISANGTVAWNRESGRRVQFPNDLTPSADGGIWFKIDQSIDQTRKWNGNGDQIAVGAGSGLGNMFMATIRQDKLIETGDGGIILTGELLGGPSSGLIFVTRLDGAGNTVFLNILDNLPIDIEETDAGLMLNSGEVVLAGRTTSNDAFLIKLNQNGEFVSTGGSGCNVNITPTNGGATITGLTSDANTKLFDANTSSVWECNPWQNNPCSSTETITGLSAGNYFLSVQSDNCEEWIPVTISGGGCSDRDGDGVCDADDCQPNNPSLPAAVGSSCNDFNGNTTNDVIQSDGCSCAGTPATTGCNVNVTPSNGGVTITGLANNANTKLFNANVSSVWECNPWQNNRCSSTETVTGLSAGNYFLSVQSASCNEWIPVTVSGGGCPDRDGDGVCDADDCRPDNSNFPTTPGTACNDGNNNTTNDVIQSNGCTCAGTPATSGCNVNVTSSNGGVNITGLTSSSNTKLFDPSVSSVWECNPWQNNRCSNNERVNGLTTGATYFLSVQSSTCNEWIPITIQGGGGNGSGGNSDGPDLSPSNLSIGSGVPGQVLFFNFNLANNGNEIASGGYTIKTYISTDATLSGNDIQEGIIATGNTPIGATAVTGAITVPNLSAGTYSFFLVVDDGNAITETNENNNVIRTTLRINGSLIDNQLTSFLSPNDKNVASFAVNNLFPNPTSGSVISQIESTFDGDISIQVTNILGQVMMSKTVPVAVGKNSLQLEMNDLQNGMYNVVFNYGNKVVAKQIVVSKN